MIQPAPGCNILTGPLKVPITLCKVGTTQPATFLIPLTISEVLGQASIHPQSFQLSRQEFFGQPANWQITIPGNRSALQLNATALPANIDTEANVRTIVNFNGQDDPQADCTRTMQCGDGATLQPIDHQEHIKLWIGYLTACGPFQQIAILSVSSLESIVRGRRHCGIFFDIPVIKFATTAGAFNYKIPEDIIIAGVLDLNQLNPIFNSFPELTRNYASIYLQLWTQDFLQDLKVVRLNKYNPVTNDHLAYLMLPPEKLEIIYLQDFTVASYNKFNVRIVNMEGKLATDRRPTNTLSQIKEARFKKLDIHNVGFNMKNEEAIIDMIRTQKILNFPTQIIRMQSTNFPFRGFVYTGGSMQSIMSYSNIKVMFITFAVKLYPTLFYPVLFQKFNLEIDQ
ncbi:MAG: hypothetical protein EZS28_004613 [Streblomastix strix]|uniref:Uncharacterized protein n=1 Tax=Streblomastix strix TaxID=222440 RepID=A0A5J4WXQ0_9EUKA|nr:MAG: hypothetical protein EZS28_004613 [Streblomastix strix]